MSLFLGKIHYWLFNKIKWFEALELEIMEFGTKQGYAVTSWKEEIYGQIGAPTEDRPLEEIIDTGNIHGWLQDKIEKSESRMASIVTKILSENPENIKSLEAIFKNQGIVAGKSYEESVISPEQAYNVMNDFILEGMPCDRVSDPLSSTDEEFMWKTTRCLHKGHWDRVGGNVENFYILRTAWAKGFLGNINKPFDYDKIGEDVHRISVI